MATATPAKPAKKNRRIPTMTIDSFLSARKRRSGAFYQVDKALAIDYAADASVDLDAMSASAIISTPAKDRVNDVLIPTGCKLDNYKLNPVVLWNHGFAGDSTPIGRSEDSNGKLTVKITDKAVEAICFFSQRSLVAAQIFELITEKIVRATSVRENPLKSFLEMGDDREQVLIVEEWELIEWSWCDIGCNPEAIAKTLSRNKLAGKPIVEPLFQSLSLNAPAKSAKGRGWSNPAKGKTVAKSATKSEQTVEDETVETTEETTTAPGDEGVEKPKGAEVLTEMHSYFTAGIEKFESAAAVIEQPEVKAAVEGAVELMKGIISGNTEEPYAKHYPNLPKLDNTADDDAKAIVEFITKAHLGSTRLRGLVHAVKSIALNKKLTPAERIAVQSLSGRMSTLLAEATAEMQAKSAEPSEATKMIEEMRKEADEVKKSLEGVKLAS